jgi:hypothetical protein
MSNKQSKRVIIFVVHTLRFSVHIPSPQTLSVLVAEAAAGSPVVGSVACSRNPSSL